ncbi:kallikrein-4 isoform X1 [Halichoerus grypus]
MVEASFSIQHPEYNKPFIANDLMLIKLKESVSGSDTIRNISIAPQCPAAGDSCLVSGWGQLIDGRQPQVLQCVNISVVPEEICNAFYAPVYHHSMFCAGGGQDRKDSCKNNQGQIPGRVSNLPSLPTPRSTSLSSRILRASPKPSSLRPSSRPPVDKRTLAPPSGGSLPGQEEKTLRFQSRFPPAPPSTE